jgi:hypothetical protein
MATSARYFDLVREMRDAYNHRLRLVESAKQRGIKPTARLFAITVLVTTTLRKLHRPPKRNLSSFAKTPPTFGSRRLISEFDLPVSHRALARVWREHGLLNNAAGNISASTTSRTSKLGGRCSSKSGRILGISTISHSYQLYLNLAKPN